MANVVGAAAGVIGAAVVIAELIPTYRQCSIEIQNRSKNYSLCNPRMHTVSGGCSVPLSPFIESSSSSFALFTKTANTARGAVGVFTYDLLNKSTKETTEKIAVMFSVPYDFNLYSNWYAVGVFEKSKECDYDLYYHMYNHTSNTFVRSKANGCCLTYKGDHVTVMAVMTNAFQPVIKVEVSDI